MRKHGVIFSFLFLTIHTLSAQSEKPSCAEYYAYINETLQSGDIERVLLQYDTLFALAKEKKDTLHLALAHSSAGEIHFMLGNMNESQRAYRQSLQYSTKLANANLVHADYMRMGSIYKQLGQPDSALYYYRKAKSYNPSVDSMHNRMLYNELGVFFENIGQGDSAIHYFLKSYEYTDPHNTNANAAIFSNLGKSFSNRMNNERALEYFNKAQAVLPPDDFPKGYTHILLNKGTSLMAMDSLKQAEMAFSEAIKYAQKSVSDREVVWAKSLLASVYVRQNRRAEAYQLFEEIDPLITAAPSKYNPVYFLTRMDLAYQQQDWDTFQTFMQKANAVLNAQGHLSYQIHLARLKARFFTQQKQFKSANSAWKTYAQLRDSFYQVSQSNIIYNTEARFQSELKEKEIALLQSQNKLSNIKLSNTRKQLIGLGGGVLLLAALLFRVFHLNKKLSVAVRQKDTLLKEIHHRVKNNLQFISSLLNLQSAYVHDPNAVEALREGQDRVHSMSLIHQKLYQEDNLTVIRMQDYFEKLTQSLFASYNIAPEKVHLDIQIDEVELDVDLAIPLGLIVNELVSNALKYAFPDHRQGRISVQLREVRQNLQLIVADNGVGLPSNQIETLDHSFGYKLIQALSTQLDGHLTIENTHGTSVSLLIENYQNT